MPGRVAWRTSDKRAELPVRGRGGLTQDVRLPDIRCYQTFIALDLDRPAYTQQHALGRQHTWLKPGRNRGGRGLAI